MPGLREAWVHRRDAMTFALIVAVVVLFCVPAGIHIALRAHRNDASAPVEVVPETGFGGYRCWGRVTQISAEWRVPTISSPSLTAFASTWIGAQNREGGYPFVQLGTTENADDGAASYQVFWSDTAVGDHPQQLATVRGGDLLAADMVLEAPGWVLEVEDRTTHVAIRKVLTYGAGASYTQGEWLQEDPTSAIVVATDLPYPATSTVHFERLEVNGAHPRLPLDDGQTLMATGGIDLTPTPLTHDAFSMVRPGPAGEQYLADAARLDGALSSYDVELSSWASAPIAARTSDITVLLRAYAHFDLSLESQVWPLPARPALQVLVQQNGQIVGACRNWEATGLGLGTPAFAEVQGAVARASSDAARADLGLAPA